MPPFSEDAALVRHLNGESDTEMARYIETMGRVFGEATTELTVFRLGGSPSAVVIAALHSYIASTSNVTELSLNYSSVTAEDMVRMCRALPKLKKLEGPNAATPDEAILAISAACPHLFHVSFSSYGRPLGEYSPAETWARHFPNLRSLNCHGGIYNNYRPTRLEAIREMALTSKATYLEIDGCHVFPDLIEAIVGTPVGDAIGTFGDDKRTKIEPAAVLAAARGFPNMTELFIPAASRMGGPSFYFDLSRTTDRITYLDILDVDTTDACIAAACRDLRLQSLGLKGLSRLTPRIVEGITRGRSAATLEYLSIDHCAQGPESPLCAIDVLRILQGCPKLGSGWLCWYCDPELRQYARLDDEPVKAILDIMRSRGTVACCHPGNHDPHYPKCIFEC